jgi:oligopeptidase B
MRPPVAKRQPHVREVHGDRVVDEWYWLRDNDDRDAIAYLEAENAYTDALTERLAPLRADLFEEIKARVQETDLSVPVRRGPWWYVSRTEEGKQYPILCRRPGPDDEPGEQILLDVNELAAGSEFFALGVSSVGHGHDVLAYSTDREGDESYTLRFKDLTTGADLPDVVEGTYYGGAWAAADDAFFYVTMDAAHRPHRVWMHALGTSATDDDTLVFEESDERFHVALGMTRSRRYVVIETSSKTTSEVLIVPTDDATLAPTVIEPRRQGIEYTIDHQGGRFLVLHNADAVDFELAEAPVATPGRAHWTPVVAHRDGTRLLDIDAFADFAVVHLRREARTELLVLDVSGSHEIELPEDVATVEPGDNAEYETRTYRLQFESMVTPPSVYDYDVDARTLDLKKRQPVLGGYAPEDYTASRLWATAADGVRVPISLVHRNDVAHDGSAPCVLYGYGSYEASMDPWFSVFRLPLLDRGVVFAVAHVRGGGEMGRRWYDDGKLLHKRNTFTDFVACASYLCEQRVTSADRLAARGGSAGGLLVGAALELAPEQFAAIVAEVPFVDPLNSMLDPSLPLTVTEWEEWGNPVADEAAYSYMKSYSPYENVTAKEYPAMLVTAGLNDTRVLYHEPAKWVAKLRATKTDDRTLLLKTEMGAGHHGPSGRYDTWHEQAFLLAFVIDEIVERRGAT